MPAAKLSRRAALGRLGAGTLFSLGLWPGALRSADRNNSGSFRFVVLNDTHYLSAACGQWLEAVGRQIRTHEGVEFCLVAGDLTEHGLRSDLGAMRDILEGLGVPAYVVIGNHDYLNPKMAAGETAPVPPLFSPSDERRHGPPAGNPLPGFDRRAYERLFPRRLNYAFKHRGWQFVGLDTSEGTRYEKTAIQLATLRWVDDHLRKLDKQLPTVIFTHFPLGPEVKYRPRNADALLERFQEHNLQAIFSGHFHGFTERRLGHVTLTTNRCCALKRDNHDGTKEKGYFLCSAGEGKITRTFVEMKPVRAA